MFNLEKYRIDMRMRPEIGARQAFPDTDGELRPDHHAKLVTEALVFRMQFIRELFLNDQIGSDWRMGIFGNFMNNR